MTNGFIPGIQDSFNMKINQYNLPWSKEKSHGPTNWSRKNHSTEFNINHDSQKNKLFEK